MADIAEGALIMLAICSVMFIVGLRATQHRSKRLGNLVGVLIVLLTVAYIVFLWDHAVLTRLIPLSNVIILGNWFPIGAAILAGIACGRLKRHRTRQVVTAVGMLVIGALGLFWPLLGSPPKCDEKWDGDICLQTTQSSCMAAASATLLRKFGIDTSEQQMARLCFTRKGTNWLGLYHGLSLKLRLIDKQPFLFDETIEELLNRDEPQIISCELTEAAAKKHPEMAEDWGWLPGIKHAVVLLGRSTPEDRVVIADPANGLEEWTLDELTLLWDGRGVRVVSWVP